MEKKITEQLEEARAHFYACNMAEAYRILRRFYDRLPFNVEESHSEYLPIFVRVLLELGKNEELKFYVKELEKQCQGSPLAAHRYALSVVYIHEKGATALERARRLLESIVTDPEATAYHCKARMLLANYYELKGDVAAIRFLIDSIQPITDDFRLANLHLHWKAFAAKLEKKFSLCHKLLDELFASSTLENDWYSYFCGCLTRTMAYVEEGHWSEARKSAIALRKSFEGKHFRVVERQINELILSLDEHNTSGVMTVKKADDTLVVEYGGIRAVVEEDTYLKKLFLLFLRKRSVDKRAIIQTLYGREYEGRKDDSTVYYQIHILRKWLKSRGFPEETVKAHQEGYHFVPKIELVEENPT